MQNGFSNQLVVSDNSLRGIIDRYRPDLKDYEDVYRHLHSCPELSGLEEETSATAADHLKKLGFEVHTHIGGYGVAGVLRNGAGTVTLIRADMDALPVEEKTGLPYASKRHMKNKAGKTTPVMHACGHDTHVVSMMAAASLLHAAKAHWSGTLIIIFQPAEEHLNGARAMLDDGLYEKIPKPDVVLAQHVMRMKTGTVSIRSGRLLTAADSINIRIFGRGGHGSAPQTCIDPIVIGAAVITRLQSVVSREVTPGEVAVVSCGSFQSGTVGNIIPDTCDIKLSVRTYGGATRERVITAIKRIVRAECDAAGAVEEPLIKIRNSPATINDDATVRALKHTFGSFFQEDLVDSEAATASEDFSLLATEVGAPYAMWTYGGVDAQTWDDAVAHGKVNELPNNHSPYFAPVIEPTLQTAVDAMAVGALTFLKKD